MQTAKSTSLFKFGIAALATVTLALFTVGCSQNTPNAPTNLGVDGFKALAHVESHDGFTELGQDGSYVYTNTDNNGAMIGPRGGSFNLHLGGAVSRFVVPSRALAEEVLITAEAGTAVTPHGTVYLYDFSPDGLHFLRPATLILEDEFESDQLWALYWYNPDTGQWQVEQVGNPNRNGRITFQIHHFSKYAISKPGRP